MKLYEKNITYIEVDKKRYKIRPSFDRILEAIDILNNDWSEEQKIKYLVWLLFYKKPKNPVKAINQLLKTIVGENKNDSSERLFDFTQDAPFIYAAFYQAYGIDLQKCKDDGKNKNYLHWNDFIALFCGLPSNTRIREIMEIRGKKIPAPTKYNHEYIQALVLAKSSVKLQINEKEKNEKYKSQLQKVAMKLISMAKREA